MPRYIELTVAGLMAQASILRESVAQSHKIGISIQEAAEAIARTHGFESFEDALEELVQEDDEVQFLVDVKSKIEWNKGWQMLGQTFRIEPGEARVKLHPGHAQWFSPRAVMMYGASTYGSDSRRFLVTDVVIGSRSQIGGGGQSLSSDTFWSHGPVLVDWAFFGHSGSTVELWINITNPNSEPIMFSVSVWGESVFGGMQTYAVDGSGLPNLNVSRFGRWPISPIGRYGADNDADITGTAVNFQEDVLNFQKEYANAANRAAKKHVGLAVPPNHVAVAIPRNPVIADYFEHLGLALQAAALREK